MSEGRNWRSIPRMSLAVELIPADNIVKVCLREPQSHDVSKRKMACARGVIKSQVRQDGIKRETDELEYCFIALKIKFMWLCVCVCFCLWVWLYEPRWPIEARRYWLSRTGVTEGCGPPVQGVGDSTWVLCKRWKNCWPLGHLFRPDFLKIHL